MLYCYTSPEKQLTERKLLANKSNTQRKIAVFSLVQFKRNSFIKSHSRKQRYFRNSAPSPPLDLHSYIPHKHRSRAYHAIFQHQLIIFGEKRQTIIYFGFILKRFHSHIIPILF